MLQVLWPEVLLKPTFCIWELEYFAGLLLPPCVSLVVGLQKRFKLFGQACGVLFEGFRTMQEDN